MRICGRQAGENSQSPPRTLVRLEGVSRFAGNALMISLLALSTPGLLFAQQGQQPSPLTLQQAVSISLEKNPERKAALADTKAASAGREGSSVLPLAARHFFRDGHAWKRPCVRLWQQIATTAVHDGRLRAECTEYSRRPSATSRPALAEPGISLIRSVVGAR